MHQCLTGATFDNSLAARNKRSSVFLGLKSEKRAVNGKHTRYNFFSLSASRLFRFSGSGDLARLALYRVAYRYYVSCRVHYDVTSIDEVRIPQPPQLLSKLR